MSRVGEWKMELEELDKSDIDCPQCGETKLTIYPEGTSPDDYTNKLICSQCGYEESE